MKKYSVQVIAFMVLLALGLILGCDEVPAWKLQAYKNGPIASGIIMKIEPVITDNWWSGIAVNYIIQLDTGAVIVLHSFEYRGAGALMQVGTKITVYYSGGGGHVIEQLQ